MFYGYDVKNDSSELIIASEVFKSALNPIDNPLESETSMAIGKIMVITLSWMRIKCLQKSHLRLPLCPQHLLIYSFLSCVL